MTPKPSFDVFLSHSSEDKAVVRRLAERLKADGIRVWFDEWQLRPGDSIPAAIENGLEHSRVLVLCMSEHAFGSDWTQLEADTFRFRDPLNRDRRFIPLRLDDTPARGSLAQFLYIDWRAERREQEYPKLLAACRPAKLLVSEVGLLGSEFSTRTLSLGSAEAISSVAFSKDGELASALGADGVLRFWDSESGRSVRVLPVETDTVESIGWSPDGRRIVSRIDDTTAWLWDADAPGGLLTGEFDGIVATVLSPDGRRVLSAKAKNTILVWDAAFGTPLRVLKGHSDTAWTVAWSRDSRHAFSGSEDETVRLWDTESGDCVRVFHGHRATVTSVAESPDGRWILSGSHDNCAHIWDIASGRCVHVLMGHAGSVSCVAWSPDSRYALTGSHDGTLRIWNAEAGYCEHKLVGHSGSVLSVAWSPDGRRLLSGSADNTARIWKVETGEDLRLLEGHVDIVADVAARGDFRLAVSASRDTTLRVWDLEKGRCLRTLQGHRNKVTCVALSPDGRSALSGCEDGTLRHWGIETSRLLYELEADTHITSVAWSPEGNRGLATSADGFVRVWDAHTGALLYVFKGPASPVTCVVASRDGTKIISGDFTGALRIWDVESGRCLRVLEGHKAIVWTVDVSADGRVAISGSSDNTLRIWEVETGQCLRVLEGHVSSVDYLALNADGRHVLSASADGTVRLWNIESGDCLRMLLGLKSPPCSVGWASDGKRAFAATEDGCMYMWDLAETIGPLSFPTERHVQYTNAKVLLVGESGAGKTGLSMRLALQDWKPSDSTVGAWATQWKLPMAPAANVEREIWLWDFGGQADQRLIHQLYMNDTSVAVLVFDGQKDNLFDTLAQWDRDLTRASRNTFTKLLAAGRVDAGGLRSVSRGEIEKFAKEKGFSERLFETSARTGADCEPLRDAIQAGIDWDNLPWRSSPLLFKRLKEEVVQLKDEGRVLMRFNELRDGLRLRLAGTDTTFQDDELKAVIGLLGGPGVVWELSFGNWVLLQPELINAYAQAVIQTLRADEFERGCLPEERVLRGDLTYQSSAQRLEGDEERFVLLAMHQTLMERGLCLREHTDSGPLLIFPSYYRRERPERSGNPAVLVSYRFNGFLDDIYATLVVRLHHTKPFEHHQLWRHAADFKTLTGKTLGLSLTRRFDGSGELEVYFDPAIGMEEKIIFSRYIHEHLLQKAENVVRLRHYVCPHCATPVGNREIAMDRLEKWLAGGGPAPAKGSSLKAGTGAAPQLPTIVCQQCEDRVPLWDELERCFASPEIDRRVQELQQQAAFVLDSESKERALVGEVISTVALAGQISRELTVSDHGIDMEIEFKDDAGEATGRKVYLQLKSGDSHVRTRRRDGGRVFPIKDERHVRYWVAQPVPVFLVVRSSSGELSWMEVRELLREISEDGRRAVKQIAFEGERFDVMSVRRWRERVLGARE